MKKSNEKGFILVETLIVTVFVVSLFLFVYRIAIPSIGEYEMHNYYDDIDSIYYTNLYKQMISRYANTGYIDEYLNSHTYIDMSDCSDTTLYKNNSYCQLIRDKVCAKDTDKIFLTKYDIKDFKSEVKSNEYFDSGTLSNFRNYINTVSNYESFYTNLTNTTNYIGKYRLFMIRTVEDIDTSTSRRYSNVGIYTGTNGKFLMGDKVIFDPGDGEKEFYVLKNSPSTDDYVTLILANNIKDSVCFNLTKTSTAPTLLLDELKEATKDWTNVSYLTGYQYQASAGYTINYNGFRARLLEDTDIMEFLGCKEDDKKCFDVDDSFTVEFNNDKLNFLLENLADNAGYWSAISIKGSDLYAWTIRKNSYSPVEDTTSVYATRKSGILPTELSDCTNIGVRPVIKADKNSVRRAD